jgi:hypothetical protein
LATAGTTLCWVSATVTAGRSHTPKDNGSKFDHPEASVLAAEFAVDIHRSSRAASLSGAYGAAWRQQRITPAASVGAPPAAIVSAVAAAAADVSASELAVVSVISRLERPCVGNECEGVGELHSIVWVVTLHRLLVLLECSNGLFCLQIWLYSSSTVLSNIIRYITCMYSSTSRGLCLMLMTLCVCMSDAPPSA